MGGIGARRGSTMRKGLNMTAAQVRAHQEKHGFLKADVLPTATIEKIGHEIKRLAGPRRGRKPHQNKTELAFGLILEAMKRKGEIVDYYFEGVTFRLADRCKFTPDFFVIVSLNPLKIRFCETKGRHIWDDSKVKFRVAKEQFHWAEWEMHQRIKGQWQRIL